MKQSMMNAYAEVDAVLSCMNKEYVQEIPESLRDLFKNNKSENCKKFVVSDKPLKEQNLSKEALAILAALNYNFWCKDEFRKKQLLGIYYDNEKKYQEDLKNKYNPNNLFKAKQITDNSKNATSSIIEYKEKNIFKKLFNKIKLIFKK